MPPLVGGKRAGRSSLLRAWSSDRLSTPERIHSRSAYVSANVVRRLPRTWPILAARLAAARRSAAAVVLRESIGGRAIGDETTSAVSS